MIYFKNQIFLTFFDLSFFIILIFAVPAFAVKKFSGLLLAEQGAYIFKEKKK